MKILAWFLGRLLIMAIILPILAALAFILVSDEAATLVADAASRCLAVNPEADFLGIRRVLPTSTLPTTASQPARAAATTSARRVAANVWHHTAIASGRTTVTFANESTTDAWSDCTVTLPGGYRGGPFQLPPLGRAELRPDGFRTASGQALPASSGALLTAGALTLRCVASDGRPATITTR